MDKQKLNQFAGVVASDLRQTEEAIDKALSQAAMLINTLVEGRLEAQLPAQAGQQVLAKMSEAVASVIDSREKVVSAHRLLEATAMKLDISWTMGGPFEPKPDLPEPTGKILGMAA